MTMKKLFLMVIAVMFGVVAATAQDEKPRKLTKQKRKALRERIDSLKYAQAEGSIMDSMFVLEADEVVFKRGYTAHVTSNTNFVAVEGDQAVVQVAFNVPWSGFNGLGGITVEGLVSKYETRKDKRGNLYLDMSVNGRGISAQVSITLLAGSNRATITILPNFHSGRLTLNGVIVPEEESTVFKGTTL